MFVLLLISRGKTFHVSAIFPPIDFQWLDFTIKSSLPTRNRLAGVNKLSISDRYAGATPFTILKTNFVLNPLFDWKEVCFF